jgi:hypothetical protein
MVITSLIENLKFVLNNLLGGTKTIRTKNKKKDERWMK